MRKTSYALLPVIALMAALLLSACSPSISIGGQPSKPHLSVLQVLQNSQKAMSKLKSAHVDLQAHGSGQAVNSAATPTTATPTTANNSLNFSLTGSGDEALPGQEEMHISTTTGQNNSTNAITEILDGNKVYVQNNGQWYVFNSSEVNGVGNPFAGFGSPSVTELLALLIHTQITDHGDQSLNGMTLRHITLALDKYALKQLLDNNKQLVSMLGQQNIDAAVDNAKTFNATIDLWIDEQQFYVHRSELKLNLNVDAASLSQSVTPTVSSTVQGLIPSNVITNLDSIVDLSKLNQPVSITPPASATPVAIPTITPTP